MSTNKNNPDKFLSPIFCWDVYSMYLHEKKQIAQKSNDFHALQKLHQQYHWQVELESILVNAYEALVVTDTQKIIRWVNEGFTKMTGYPAYTSIGKSPAFLQGRNTSAETKKRIRQKLSEQIPFSENIINYRKNGEEYVCHVEIHPLINDKDQLTHFLALEREILSDKA